ncbi:MAG: PAS domain S-box protein [Deltaproteobacteria bacterium]|nr:PAS domain S-box protein [Deltaproteobacteria bacterium]
MEKKYLRILIVTLFLFLGGILSVTTASADHPEDHVIAQLTEEEKAFLAGKEFRLGVDADRAPFEFFDEKGDYAGITAEFVEMAARHLGVVMVPQKGLKWTEAIEKTKVGQIDIIPKMTPTAERKKFLIFTKPYITFPSVIVMRKGHSASGLDDLKGLKVGVVKGLVIEANLKRDRPDLPLIPMSDLETALRELSAGKLDAFIDNLGPVTYTIDKVGLANLKIAGETPYTHDLAMGVRKDWPLLASALDKAIAGITEQEKAEIKQRWLAIQYTGTINWMVVGPIGSGLLAITAFVLIWNRRLGKAITERKAAEKELTRLLEETKQQAKILKYQQEKLKETEAWFRGIIESAPDGILVTDNSGVIILTNAMVDKMFGYQPGDLLNKNVDILVPEDIRAGHGLKRESFMQTLTGREMGSGLNLRGVRRDGSEYPAEIGLSKLPASGSRGTCVCVSIRDITERKAAESALAKSREILQGILDTSPIAVAVFVDGVIRFANPHFTNLLGPRVGDPAPPLCTDAGDRDALAELLRQQEIVSDFDVQMFGTDNKIHNFMATYLRTEYKGEKGALAWLVDITKIKTIEKALTAAEERSRLLLESAGEGIFGVDTSGQMTFANPAALRMWGYGEEELLGKKIQPIIYQSLPDVSPNQADDGPMSASYKGGETRRNVNEIWWRKDGNSFYVDYSSTPIYKENILVGAVVTFGDVTERKKVERELEQYVKDLERFNRLVVGREIRMLYLKQEINELRRQAGQSAKYIVPAEVDPNEGIRPFKEEREEPTFDWTMLGDITKGRPNLGSSMDVALYRLLQFTLRDVIIAKFNSETADKLYFEAGEMAGRELYRAMMVKVGSFDEFMKELQELFGNLKMGILKIEKAELETMNFVLTLAEDLGCSGLPISNETICNYDEGFISGLLLEHTGSRFNVKEVACWCSGDKLCRFEAKPAA